MHKLYELKEKLVRELEDFAGKDINGSSLQTIDTLAHAAKNLCKIIESADDEYAEDGGSSYRRGYSRDGGSYRGMSYRRDSRGRYASRYSAGDAMMDKLDDLMDTAPEEMKSEIQRLKSKVEQMR